MLLGHYYIACRANVLLPLRGMKNKLRHIYSQTYRMYTNTFMKIDPA